MSHGHQGHSDIGLQFNILYTVADARRAWQDAIGSVRRSAGRPAGPQCTVDIFIHGRELQERAEGSPK